MENVENDDICMTVEEFAEFLEDQPSLDIKRSQVALEQGDHHWYIIICEDETVMMRKEHYKLISKINNG